MPEMTVDDLRAALAGVEGHLPVLVWAQDSDVDGMVAAGLKRAFRDHDDGVGICLRLDADDDDEAEVQTAPASPPASPGGGEPALPEITDAVLAQWEESARADHEAGRTWSVNPLAILAVVRRLRTAPPPPGGDGAREAREKLARLLSLIGADETPYVAFTDSALLSEGGEGRD